MGAALYKRHRFPAEIISHCIWLYFRFCLSFRDVEEIMFERGIVVTYESIRKWCLKFGCEYVKRLKRRRSRLGDTWHLDEVHVSINGEKSYLWRAVDQQGNTLDILVQKRRNKKAAKRFLKKLLGSCQYAPRVVVTDKLRSYAAAMRDLLPFTPHRQSRYLNNRAENSHQPTRERERRMRCFKSPKQAQRFLSIFEPLKNHFRPRRHLLSASSYRHTMIEGFTTWREITEVAAVS